MPEDIIGQAISSLAVAGFFAVAAGYFLIQMIKVQTLKKSGVKTPATIVSRNAVSNGYAGKFTSQYNFSIEYEFTANGQIYRKKLENIRKAEFLTYEEGQQINVVYAPKNPANNMLEAKLGSQNIVVILFFLGCCYAVLTYLT